MDAHRDLKKNQYLWEKRPSHLFARWTMNCYTPASLPRTLTLMEKQPHLWAITPSITSTFELCMNDLPKTQQRRVWNGVGGSVPACLGHQDCGVPWAIPRRRRTGGGWRSERTDLSHGPRSLWWDPGTAVQWGTRRRTCRPPGWQPGTEGDPREGSVLAAHRNYAKWAGGG